MNIIFKEFVEKYKILNRSQISTNRGARTSDHIFVLRILFEKYVKREKSTLFACFVDFKKAVDKVWRMGLLYKLQLMDIKGHFYNVIKDMYDKSEVCVKIGDRRTGFFYNYYWSQTG